MKILLIIDDYLPHSIKIGAKMMHELAVQLRDEGHTITVLTPDPDLDETKREESLDGVTVWRFRSGRIKNVGKIRRAINETLLSYHAWRTFGKELRKHPADLVVYYSPTIFWGPLVERLKKMWGARSYLILRDIFPQWAVDQGLIRKKSAVERYFLHFEAKNYAAADTIGLMSPRNLAWFETHKTVDAKLEILPNWASNTPTLPTGEHRKRLKLQDKIIYFYGGNMGHAQDMMNIVRLAERMTAHPKAHFLLVGTGDEVPLVEKAIVQKRLRNITLLPPVPQEIFKQILAECDVGLFTLHREHTTHNFPGKLLGYMVQGMPVLGSVNPGNDLKETMEESGAGLIAINGEDDTLYANALRLLDAQERRRIGKGAKELLEKSFSVQSAARKILESARTHP